MKTLELLEIVEANNGVVHTTEVPGKRANVSALFQLARKKGWVEPAGYARYRITTEGKEQLMTKHYTGLENGRYNHESFGGDAPKEVELEPVEIKNEIDYKLKYEKLKDDYIDFLKAVVLNYSKKEHNDTN